LEGFPFKFGQITNQPIINPLMHQEDFQSLFGSWQPICRRGFSGSPAGIRHGVFDEP